MLQTLSDTFVVASTISRKSSSTLSVPAGLVCANDPCRAGAVTGLAEEVTLDVVRSAADTPSLDESLLRDEDERGRAPPTAVWLAVPGAPKGVGGISERWVKMSL